MSSPSPALTTTDATTVTSVATSNGAYWVYLRGILAGTVSGVTKLVTGHPFDTIKVRMQTEGGIGRFKGPIHCLKETVQKEGFRALYKGATPPLFGWGIIDSVMWGSLVQFRRILRQQQADPTQPLSIKGHAIAGVGAGLVSTIVVTPIEQIKARLQVQYHDAASQRYKGPIDCIRQLVKNNGVIGGLYKGYSGTVSFRVFMGFYFASYEWFSRELRAIDMPVMLENFLAGGLAATALWCVSFPTDVLKNRMMAQPDVYPRKYPNIVACAKYIYRTEGIPGFYRGFTPCLLRSFPTNGSAFVAAELMLRILPTG